MSFQKLVLIHAKLDYNHQINLKDPFTYYYIYYEDKEIKGFISYAIIYDRCELNYILIKPEYRKQGIAHELLMKVVDYARRENKKIIPQCSYAKEVLTKHEEYKDVL